MGNYHIEIGKQLKARRLEQKREIKDLANDTKVSESYIEAIEAGRIDEFPSSVYYNLFARSYARELGFDPDQIFTISGAEGLEMERVEAMGSGSSEETTKLRDSDEGNGSMAKTIIWIAVIIIAAIVVFLWIFKDGYISNSSIDESPNPVYEQENKIQDVDSAVELTDTNSDTMTVEDLEPPQPIQPKMKLRIDAIALSWILVMSDGDTVLNRNLDSGSYRTVEADYNFAISTGNPDGLLMKLDDVPMKPISSGGRPVRNVIIDRQNKDEFIKTAEDSL